MHPFIRISTIPHRTTTRTTSFSFVLSPFLIGHISFPMLLQPAPFPGFRRKKTVDTPPGVYNNGVTLLEDLDAIQEEDDHPVGQSKFCPLFVLVNTLHRIAQDSLLLCLNLNRTCHGAIVEPRCGHGGWQRSVTSVWCVGPGASDQVRVRLKDHCFIIWIHLMLLAWSVPKGFLLNLRISDYIATSTHPLQLSVRFDPCFKNGSSPT